MLTGNTMNLTLNAGVTSFLHPSGPSDVWGATTFAEMLSPNVPVIARDLAIQLGGVPGAGESYTITLLVNGTDTALTCQVTGDTAMTCTSGAQVPVPAGSRLCFKVDVSAGATQRRVLFAWRATDAP
jgi:hypothetical protein